MVKRLDELYATLGEVPPPPPAAPAPPKNKIMVTGEQQAEMIRLYAGGKTIRQIAAITFWSRTTVRRMLLLNGVKLRSRASWARLGRRDQDAFLYTAQLYGRGMSLKQVAEIVGASRSTVRYRLLAMDVKLKPRGVNYRHDHHRSPEKRDERGRFA